MLIPRGDRRNPLSEAELRAKLRANAGLVLREAQVAELEETIAHIAGIKNVGEVAALLVPRAGRVREAAAPGPAQ